jgi:hypothetical protein
MTHRDAIYSLMAESLDDAERLLKDRWGVPVRPETAATVAAALFAARVDLGAAQLLRAISTS